MDIEARIEMHSKYSIRDKSKWQIIMPNSFRRLREIAGSNDKSFIRIGSSIFNNVREDGKSYAEVKKHPHYIVKCLPFAQHVPCVTSVF